jgi:hypothetical protein
MGVEKQRFSSACCWSEASSASATMGGSCTHPDQSRGLARRRNLRAISRSESPPLFYSFSSWVV